MSSGEALLIGAGRMGRSHAMALKELGLTLAAVCDLRADARNALGQEFSIAESARFADAASMLAAFPRPRLVVIATTANTHFELVQAAAGAGAAAIVCEKPMAASIDQCVGMIEACARAGARLAINHQMRFMPQYELVKSILDEGLLGRLASMTVVAGSFGLAMNGSHYVEAFNFLTGAWPASVSAHFTGEPINNPRGAEFFDQGGEFRFLAKSGQRLNIMIGHDQGHGMTVTYAGEYGHIFVDELEGEAIVTARREAHRSAPMTRYGMPWQRKTHRFTPADNVQPTKRLMEALLNGANYADGQTGLRVVSALACCYDSAEQDGRKLAIEAAHRDTARLFPWA